MDFVTKTSRLLTVRAVFEHFLLFCFARHACDMAYGVFFPVVFEHYLHYLHEALALFTLFTLITSTIYTINTNYYYYLHYLH